VNLLSLTFEDKEVQEDHDKHVNDGQAEMYPTIFLVILFRAILNLTNYISTR
jgi:hypothetical protein